MRAAAIVVALALIASGAAARAESRLVDTILAEIGSSVVTLSDVTLARALGAFGLEPSAGPVTEAELSQFLDAQLAVREADNLAIEVSAADLDRAWASAGGAALAARLEAAGIDPAWGRRLVEADLRVERFVDLRFRAFAFVTDFDVDEALGPGSYDDAARQRTRARLQADLIAKAYGEWTTDARRRVPIRRAPGATGPWPPPFTLGPPRK